MSVENAIGVKPLTVPGGGTGAETLTAHGVLVGSDAALITPLAVGTDGQVLLGSAGADPVFATLTSTDGTIDFTLGAGTLNLESTGSVLEINDTAATAYTLVLGDSGDLVEFTSDATVTVTIPPDSDVPFPEGTTILLLASGEGLVTIEEGAGVELGSRGSVFYSAGQGAMMSLTKLDTDEWILAGDIGGGGGGADNFVSQWNIFRNLSYSLNSVTYGDGRFIAVSSASPSQPYALNYVTSDENWYTVGGLGSPNYSRAFDVEYGDDGYWVAGNSSSSTAGRIFITTDPAATWSYRSTGKGINVVGQGNGYWVLAYEGNYGVANSSSFYVDDPLYGTFQACSLGGGYFIRDILYANGLWVAACYGFGAPWTGWAFHTTDPTGAWTTSAAIGTHIAGVAYGNGYWVVVGKGCVYTSTDPASGWVNNTSIGRATGNSPSGYQALNSVTYANGHFIAVGVHGLVIKADDPTGEWKQLSVPVSTTLNSITYGDNKVVAVGDGGIIIMSDAQENRYEN